MKKYLTLCLVLAILLSICALGGVSASAVESPGETSEEEDIFADWNDGAPALGALIDYVEAVTDESSPDYIPPADRIAVFDMDGTLCAELCPTYLEYYLLAWRILKDPPTPRTPRCWNLAACCGITRSTRLIPTAWTCCTPPMRRRPMPA